jgi:hypothetical protein
MPLFTQTWGLNRFTNKINPNGFRVLILPILGEQFLKLLKLGERSPDRLRQILWSITPYYNPCLTWSTSPLLKIRNIL